MRKILRGALILLLFLLFSSNVFAHPGTRHWTAEEVTTLGTNDEYFIPVYVTDTGSRYHSEHCYHIQSKTKITLFTAVSEGYTPCLDCVPFPIPDNYYTFQEMNIDGTPETKVYVLDNEYHRRMCPQVAENRTTYSLCDTYSNNFSACNYCNPPQLSYNQIQELKGNISYSFAEPVDWLSNPILTALLAMFVIYIGYSLFLYVREIYLSLKNANKKRSALPQQDNFDSDCSEDTTKP